ncbi:MAG: 3',5'-cyclic-nucleotide phosphodiesterase [Campylobacterota bacterium]|nr:3',5'-cyclic-nucleotide phosphodiesterase [Campylobacterota bacterium]
MPFNTDKKSSIKVLGASGGKSTNTGLTSFQLSKEITIDAGNIMLGLGNGIYNINHIFVTHGHLDHIADIPFLIDSTFDKREIPLKIYGRKGTIDSIKNNIFNNEIWPDFSKINLINSNLKAIEYIEIEINKITEVEDCIIKAIKNNHSNSSNGFVVEKSGSSILFTSDTYICDDIWDEINENQKITTVVIDISFPSNMEQLAYDSKHLTPSLFKSELKKLNREDVTIHIHHLKPSARLEITTEIIKENLLLNGGKILEEQDIVEF